MTGKVVEVDVKNRKVKVGVKLFGRTNIVDLDFNQVTKAVPKNDDN
jgi:transcription antitermination factor NusG